MFVLVFLVVISSITCHVSAGESGPCSSRSAKTSDVIADLEDSSCSSFYICHGSNPTHFTCGTKIGLPKVFDPISHTCVLKGSKNDNSACNIKAAAYKVLPQERRCIPREYATFEDPNNCARYYVCNGGVKPVSAECPYPRLWNTKYHRCDFYSFVKCGIRSEPKDPCDYEANQCRKGFCVPCRVRFGTCIGLPDGPNAWKGRLWTPFFVICKDQRVILNGDCRQNGKVQLYNPRTRRCIPIMKLLQQAVASRNTKRIKAGY